MSNFDLKSYLDRFPEISKAKFNKVYSFSRLEKEFEPLREGRRWLAARDVIKIFDTERTPFARYWPRVSEKDLDQVLAKQRLVLAPVPPDGREPVERLLEVFHNLGQVSLVLRFVHPDRFGIFSTPLVNLLQVHSPTLVEMYLTFCNELRAWQEHFGIPSVAETEMALWAFYESTIHPRDAADAERARLEFDGDLWIQRRRVAQIITPFIAGHGPLQLAQILAQEHPRLAAMIAGVEFERLLRLKARQIAGSKKRPPKTGVDDLIRELAGQHAISWAESRELRNVWSVRNRAVHPDRHFSLEQVEAMIEAIETICCAWEA